MNYLAGFGKEEINCFITGVGMMGYGQPHNTIKEKGTPLFARSYILKQENFLLIHIHLELAFVSIALREEIFSRLKNELSLDELKPESILITAQHTHSGPGGFSHYPFYNFSIPNFQKKIFESICEASIQSIKIAFKNMTVCSIQLGEIRVTPNLDLASNRSIEAFQNNLDVSPSHSKEEAIDLRMTGLKFLNEKNEIMAFINWFGVHCTSISSFNNKMHSDNKGIAANLVERQNPGSIAFFLQSAAGDVSPNYFWDKTLKRNRGKYRDQFESCEYNAQLQFEEFKKINYSKKITRECKSIIKYVDISKMTAPAAHGIAFFQGTLEGPGLTKSVTPILEFFSRRYEENQKNKSKEDKHFFEQHYPKKIMLDHRNGSFLGLNLRYLKYFPKLPDAIFNNLKQTITNNSLHTLPWVPHIIPFQLVKLGNILLATIPGEITVQASKRLEEHLYHLSQGLVEKIIITSYANGYMGYVTTPEEYDIQAYEGGHNVYGRKTLDAIIEIASELMFEILNIPSKLMIPSESPFQFPIQELEKRSQ